MADNYDTTLDFEIAFLEGVLELWPENIDALRAIAEDYTSRGLYDKGLQADLRLARLLPNDSTVHYNLACSHALVGNYVEAFDSLETAIALGYDDERHMRRDPDLQSIRGAGRFQELLASIRRAVEDRGQTPRT